MAGEGCVCWGHPANLEGAPCSCVRCLRPPHAPPSPAASGKRKGGETAVRKLRHLSDTRWPVRVDHGPRSTFCLLVHTGALCLFGSVVVKCTHREVYCLNLFSGIPCIALKSSLPSVSRTLCISQNLGSVPRKHSPPDPPSAPAPHRPVLGLYESADEGGPAGSVRPHLACFTERPVLQVRPCGSRWQNPLPFSGWIIFHCMIAFAQSFIC